MSFMFSEDNECITYDEIKQALYLIPEEIITEKNVKWFIQIFGWEQLCHDINALGGRVYELCKSETVVEQERRDQYYLRLLGSLTNDEFKDLLVMVYNRPVTLVEMYDKYKDKIFHAHHSYSFFGLMCLIIKTIKSYRNDWNVRSVLNRMYPSIFLSPQQVESRLQEIKRRELVEAALEREIPQPPLSHEEKELRRKAVDAQHKLMISGQAPVTYDKNGEPEPNPYHSAVFERPPPPSGARGARGGSRRRRRTAHRKRKSHRKSKRVHHTRKKHTRRHRHSRHRRHHRH